MINVGHPNGAPQIPPLRFAPVGMTNRRGSLIGEDRFQRIRRLPMEEGSAPQRLPYPLTTVTSFDRGHLL